MSDPIFALTAVPLSRIEMPDLFGDRDRPLIRALDNPPTIRPHGFDLEHRSSSKIIAGNLRRASVPKHNILELWRDGVLIFAIDGHKLCWWNNPPRDETLRINPLVLIESTYNFASLSQRVYAEAIPAPERIEFGILLRDITINGKPAEMVPALGISFDAKKSPTGEDTKHAYVVWDKAEVKPGLIAYQLVREIYRWFGFEDSSIPFTALEEDSIAIDPEEIRSLDRQ
jgi:hypothetical protein